MRMSGYRNFQKPIPWDKLKKEFHNAVAKARKEKPTDAKISPEELEQILLRVKKSERNCLLRQLRERGLI